MNLGDQLRAALSQEADMQYATPPDVDRLIIGGRVSVGGTATWCGPAAPRSRSCSSAAARTPSCQNDRADENPIVDTPKASVPELPEDAGSSTLEPGTYRVLVGSTPTAPPSRRT